jgi:membrane protein implicated in regulation of membrane protease activity
MGTENRNITTEKKDFRVYEEDKDGSGSRKTAVILIGAAVLLIALIVLAVFFLIRMPAEDTARVRDIFIIFMALESLLLGMVLIILIVQIARLTNLMQNEIKPILESTQETVSTLKGTTAFMSDNLVQPVMKMNEYLAAIGQLAAILGVSRRRNKNK